MVFFYNHYPDARPLLFGQADTLFTSFGMYQSEYGSSSYYGGTLPREGVEFSAPKSYRTFNDRWSYLNKIINKRFNKNPYGELILPYDEKKVAPIIAKCYLLYLEDLRGRIGRDNYTYVQVGEVYKHCFRLLDFVLNEAEMYMAKKYLEWFETYYPDADEETRTIFLNCMFYYVDDVETLVENIKKHNSYMRFVKMVGNKVVETDENGIPVSEYLKNYYKDYTKWYDKPPYIPITTLDKEYCSWDLFSPRELSEEDKEYKIKWRPDEHKVLENLLR